MASRIQAFASDSQMRFEQMQFRLAHVTKRLHVVQCTA
jgi:hypothetical protein